MTPAETRSHHWNARHTGLLLALALLIGLSSITSIDRYAAEDHQSLFHRALVTFALARTLNGLISAVQGTEIALQPAGVGITLTPGEILDPVNDLVERFSWIMLGATISLGIQQVLLDVGQWWGMRLLLVLAGIAWFWLMLKRSPGPDQRPGQAEALTLRIFVVLVFLRFAVPLALIANEALYELFLESRYLESTQVIETAGAEIEAVGLTEKDNEPSQNTGLMGALSRAYNTTRDTLNLEQRIEHIKLRAADVIEHLIQLSVVFILQTGVLPLAFLWLLIQLLKSLVRFRTA